MRYMRARRKRAINCIGIPSQKKEDDSIKDFDSLAYLWGKLLGEALW